MFGLSECRFLNRCYAVDLFSLTGVGYAQDGMNISAINSSVCNS